MYEKDLVLFSFNPIINDKHLEEKIQTPEEFGRTSMMVWQLITEVRRLLESTPLKGKPAHYHVMVLKRKASSPKQKNPLHEPFDNFLFIDIIDTVASASSVQSHVGVQSLIGRIASAQSSLPHEDWTHSSLKKEAREILKQLTRDIDIEKETE